MQYESQQVFRSGSNVINDGVFNDLSASSGYPSGGAVYIAGYTTHLTLNNSLFTDNSVATKNRGGAVYIEQGGALVTDTVCTVNGCTFNHNTAPDRQGGAIAVYYVKGAVLNVSDTLFVNNQAYGSGGASLGGAIYIGTENIAAISGSTFTGNYQGNTGAVQGGAVYNEGTATITGGYFTTAKDTIGNTGTLTFAGTVTLAASVTGTGTGTYTLAADAGLNFVNTAAISVSAFTAAGNNTLTFNNNQTVTFAAGQSTANLSLVLDAAALGAALDTTFTVATGLDLSGTQPAITAGGQSVTLGEAFKIGSVSYTLNYDAGTSALTLSGAALPILTVGTGAGEMTWPEALAAAGAAVEPKTIVFSDTLFVGGDSVTLSDGGSLTGIASSGAAVAGRTDKTVKISGSRFEAAANKQLALSNLVITDNASVTEGGAVKSNGMLTITDSVFYKNGLSSTGRGGALYLGGGTASISGSTFSRNSSSSRQGGAIAVMAANVTLNISDSFFTINNAYGTGTACLGGGIYVISGSTLSVSGSTFTGNIQGYTAGTVQGGALYNEGTATVNGGYFTTVSDTIGNSGTGTLTFAGTVTLAASVTGTGTYTLAADAGLNFVNTAAISVSAFTAAGSNTLTFNNNQTVTFAAGQSTANLSLVLDAAALGASLDTTFTVASGLDLSGTQPAITAGGQSVTLGEAFKIGSVSYTLNYDAGTSALTLSGAALPILTVGTGAGEMTWPEALAAAGAAAEPKTIVFSDTLFVGGDTVTLSDGGNLTAITSSGAAISGRTEKTVGITGSHFTLSTGKTLAVSDVTFYGNVYAGSGGVITSGGTLSLTGVSFRNNRLTGNSRGGAFYLTGGSAEVNTCLFSGNSSNARQGGAIGIDAAGVSLTVSNTLFAGNVASGGSTASLGGAIYVLKGASAVITGSTFTGNLQNSAAGVAILGGALYNEGTATVNGGYFTTVSDTIGNSGTGTLTFAGTVTLAASVTGTGAYTLASGAGLNFVNTAAISVSAFTAAGNNSLTFGGTQTVTFTAQDVTGITISVADDLLNGQAYTLASGLTGTIAGITVSGSQRTLDTGFLIRTGLAGTAAAVGGTLSFRSFDTVKIVESGADNITTFLSTADVESVYGANHGLTVIQPHTIAEAALNTGWSGLEAGTVVTVAGKDYTYGTDAFSTVSDAVFALQTGGKLVVDEGQFGALPLEADGLNLEVIGGSLSYNTLTLFTSGSTVGSASMLLDGVIGASGEARLRNTYLNSCFHASEADDDYLDSLIAGDCTITVRNSRFHRYLYGAGGNIAGNLNITVENTLFDEESGKDGIFLAGYAYRLDGTITANISGSTMTMLTLLAGNGGFTGSGLSVTITDSRLRDVGFAAKFTNSGDSLVTVSGSTITGGLTVGGAEVLGDRVLTIAAGRSEIGAVGGLDQLVILAGGTLAYGGAQSTFAVLDNQGTLDLTGLAPETGATVLRIFNCEVNNSGEVLLDSGLYLSAGANGLNLYSKVIYGAGLTGLAEGQLFTYFDGTESATAVWGVNAFTDASAAAGKVDPLAPVVELTTAVIAEPVYHAGNLPANLVAEGNVFSGGASGTDNDLQMTVSGSTIQGNLYGAGTVSAGNAVTRITAGSVAKTTYGGGLFKSGESAVTSSTLTIEGGSFGSMVVGGSRISVEAGTTAEHTTAAASLVVSGGTFSGTRGYLAAAGYVINDGGNAASAAQLTVGSSTLALADAEIGQYALGGAFVDHGIATITDTSVIVSSGTYKSVFAGGWAQNGGAVEVTGATIAVTGGSIRNLYAGGTDSGDGNTTSVKTSEITVTGGEVGNLFLNGKYSRDTVTAATLNVTGECTINWIEGLCHSLAVGSKSTATAVNIGADLTVEDILHVDEWNFNTVGTLLDFGTHTADLNGTVTEVNTVIDFQIGEQSIGTEGWTAIAAKEFDGLGESSIKINGQVTEYSKESSTWTSGAYTVTLNESYDDTRKALIVTKSA